MPCSPLCTSYLWVEFEGRTFTLITFRSERVNLAIHARKLSNFPFPPKELELDLKQPELPAEDTEVAGTSQTEIAQPEAVAKEEGETEAPDAVEGEGAPSAVAPPEEDTADGAPAQEESAEEQGSSTSKAVPLTELAPAPSEADLFGDIDQLKKKHEEELAEFQKAQEMNKARVEQGLQEKLRARRSRRRKLEVQEVEKQVLTGECGSSLPPPPESWAQA